MKMRCIIVTLFVMSCSLLGYSQSAFYNLGKSYAEEGNYDDAIRLTKQSLDWSTQNTDTSSIFFDNLTLSEYYSYINQPDSCKLYADKAIKLWHKVDGIEYSDVLAILSLYFNRVGLSKLAIDNRKKVAEIYIEKYGSESPKLIKEYHIISSFAKTGHIYNIAIEYAKKEENLAYLTKDIVFEERKLSYLDSFGWLRLVIQDCEEPIAGIHCLLQCLNNHRDAIDKENRNYTLDAIWVMSRDNDFLDGCLAVYKEKTLYGDPKEMLSNLINIYVEDKNIKTDVNAPKYAQTLYDLAIQGTTLSQYFSHKDIEDILTVLTQYYRRIGLSHNYYEISKKNYEWRKKNNLDLYLHDVEVLASGFNVLSAEGPNDSLAKYLIEFGEDIIKSGRYDDDSEMRIMIYQYLVGGYLTIGDQVMANKYVALLDEDETYDSILSKAFAYFLSGDMKSTYPLYLKLGECKDIPDQDKDNILFMRIMSARATRSIKELQKCSSEYINRYRYKILNDLPILSEEEKVKYLQSTMFSSILSYDYFIGVDGLNSLIWSFSKDAYDYTLLKKGIQLTSQREFREILNSSEDSLIQSKWQFFQQQDKKFSLQNEILKRELITYATKQSSYQSRLAYTWEDVKNALKEGEVAIEFIKCYNFYGYDNIKDFNDIEIDPLYIALILRHDSYSPETVVLYRAFYTDNFDELDHSEILSNENTIIYQLFWKPLEPYLSGINTIYFSPIEDLNSVALEYASMGNGLRICDNWNLFRLSSTREIIEYRKKTIPQRAVLFGGLKYDVDREELIAESRASNSQPISTQRAVISENLRYGVEYLPGTLEEVTEIYQLFSHKPKLITDISGTEEAFKSLGDSQYDIIHLATHGFFWSESKAEKRKYVNFIKAAQLQSSTFEDNAMTRSGLIFSGANIGLMGKELPDDVEDGVLTALEISNMNLGNVDMVVMSACESGLGETSGEGVFGLQRGFKLAGANTLLMSLWKVDDIATKRLMTEFYRNYLSGKSKQQSLKLAQENLRHSNEYSDPKYWAAFILLDGLN